MAKTSGLPLGLIWRDFAIDHPAQPYPVPKTCGTFEINASGSKGLYRFAVDAGTSVGVMRVVFNTGNYLLPGDASGAGPALAVNSIPDRLVWYHGTYNNQEAGSSVGGNFYANDSSGATDVPVITIDSENLNTSSNLERVKQVGLVGGERFFDAGNNTISAVSNLRGSKPRSQAHLDNAPSGKSFGQDISGRYMNTPIFDYNASLNSGAGGFAQMVVNGVNQTADVGPFHGWIERNLPGPQVTLTPNMKTHDNSDDGDFWDIEADWQTSGTLALQVHSAGSANSVQQSEMYFPSFHASRNATYCVPIIPNNISSGVVTMEVQAPLQSTWFGVALTCPIDMETADSGNHKLNRSSIKTNWNQVCNSGNVNIPVYHMPVDAYGGVNPASVSRDENGIPIKTINNYSPSLNHTGDHTGVKLNHRVVSDIRTSDGRILWESLLTTNYINKNGRSAWKTAMTGGTDPDTLLRDWYGMEDVVKSGVGGSFPASDQITCGTFSAVSGAPSSAATTPQVGDLVVTGSNNTFGNNGTAGNITVTAVNGQTITVSGMTMTTSAALTGVNDPILRFVRMGDIQTKGHLNISLYNGSSTNINDLTGQTNGDIGIRDYLFEDRYGATPVPDGFYKIVDKNAVNNGNGGKKRVKVKDGIIIKCRNCFGSVKSR